MDDWLKLRQATGKGRRDGLKMWEKLIFQIGLSVLLSVFMYKYGGESPVLNGAGESSFPAHYFYIPFVAAPLVLLPLAHAVITTLTMVGSSNAVNLTDGMDGLAAGCVIIVGGLLTLLAWGTGLFQWSTMFSVQFVPDSLEMTVLCSSIVGACLGFLWYNANPAQVFMGDTGSLTLGGLLGYVAVVIRQEMLLFIAGGVFVMEALSVILQVSYYKATKDKNGVGRRIFRMAPLHHHFHLGGLAESKVVARFWILSIIFAVLAMATLKLKW
jgi:phospho-N-acetylmuramoyl-pentapeptide-transferase